MSSSSLQPLLAPASRLQGTQPRGQAHLKKQTAGLSTLKNRKTNNEEHKNYPFSEWNNFRPSPQKN